MRVAATTRSTNASVESMARMAASNGAGSSTASTAAASTSSLSANARKIVPSAIPAASAMSRVVMVVVASQSSNPTVAWTMHARRSSRGIAGARRLVGGVIVTSGDDT